MNRLRSQPTISGGAISSGLDMIFERRKPSFDRDHFTAAASCPTLSKNVIYEGTPHGNAELAQSKIIFMLS